MKKTITILMLIAAFMVGSATAEAKTSKKSSGSSLTLKSLTSKFYNKTSNVFNISQSQITSAMKELGFTFQGTGSGSVYDEINQSWEPATKLTYKKSGVTAEVYKYQYGSLCKISLKFASSSSAKAFISSSKKALGSSLRGNSSYYYVKNYDCWSMTQSGSTVNITLEEYQ